jgi:hypothetical protein
MFNLTEIKDLSQDKVEVRMLKETLWFLFNRLILIFRIYERFSKFHLSAMLQPCDHFVL